MAIATQDTRLGGSVPGLLPVTARAGSRPDPWVRGPVWDSVWMLNALWLVPLVLWLARGDADAEAGPLDTLYLGLTALFWIGHRLCSAWLAYCTEAYRPLLRAEPVRFGLLPLIILVVCFGVFLPPDTALPWTREERVIGFAILDYMLVTYHFAAQHFGVLALYRGRVGRGSCARTRLIDRLYALGVGGLLVLLADLLSGAVAYQDRWVNRWLDLDWLAASQDGIRAGGTLLLAAATAAVLVAELRARRSSLPRVLYILGIAAMTAIALRPQSLFPFLVIWTSQHWILATGLASQTSGGGTAPAGGPARLALHALNRRPGAVLAVLVGISVVLLPLFEVEANRDGGTYYGDRIFGALAEGLRTSAWVPALVALGFATGFLHYLLDRNVYRLSDPRVRSAARGLLVRD